MIDVNTAIEEVVKKFKGNPLIIHSERDIQALLYNELLIQETEPIDTGHILNGVLLKTNRVHCEYQGIIYKEEKERTRLIDIVVFSDKYSSQIKHQNHQLYLKKEGWDKVPCEALIEIKFEKGIKIKNTPEKIEKDFKKLRDSYEKYSEFDVKPRLYFIYFFFCKEVIDNRHPMVKFFKQLPKLSSTGEKVNTYLVIGPKRTWEHKLKNLNADFDKISLDYTI